MNVIDAEIFKIRDTGIERVVAFEFCVFFGKGEVFAFISKTAVGRDGKISDVNFPDNGFRTVILSDRSRSIEIGIPAVGVGRVEIADHSAVAVYADRRGVEIDRFDNVAADVVGVSVVNAVIVAVNGKLPNALIGFRSCHFFCGGVKAFVRFVARAVEVDDDVSGYGRPEPESRAILRIVRAVAYCCVFGDTLRFEFVGKIQSGLYRVGPELRNVAYLDHIVGVPVESDVVFRKRGRKPLYDRAYAVAVVFNVKPRQNKRTFGIVYRVIHGVDINVVVGLYRFCCFQHEVIEAFESCRLYPLESLFCGIERGVIVLVARDYPDVILVVFVEVYFDLSVRAYVLTLVVVPIRRKVTEFVDVRADHYKTEFFAAFDGARFVCVEVDLKDFADVERFNAVRFDFVGKLGIVALFFNDFAVFYPIVSAPIDVSLAVPLVVVIYALSVIKVNV